MRGAGWDALDNAHDMRSTIRRQLFQCCREILGVERSLGSQGDGGDREVIAVGSVDGVCDAHVDCFENADRAFDRGPPDHPGGVRYDEAGTAPEPEAAVP